VQRVRERLQDVRMNRGRQVLGLLGVEVNTAAQPSGDIVRQPRELAGEPGREDGSEDHVALFDGKMDP